MADSMASRLLVVVAICGMSGFISAQNSDPQIIVRPAVAIVLPGESVSFMCSVAHKFNQCRAKITGYENNFIVADSTQREEISYFGNGTEYGQCGFTIKRVEEKNNGIVNCLIQNKEGSMDLEGRMKLIVAKAPEAPIFRPEIHRNYKENEELRVQCVIAYGRPVAKMEWYLDEERLVDGLHSTSTKDEPGSQLQTITQNLTRRISVNDHGRVLKCVADHMALKENERNTISARLEVIFAPKSREDPVNIFGIKLGETGVINVTINANPRPSFEWSNKGQPITQDRDYEQGRYIPQILEIGNGFYNISLVISSVTREDTENDFILKLYNSEGPNEYRVRISTLDEPQGVDLGIGSIIGIVVSVLVILIIVILVIFAKATNRWCFGGGVLRTDIPDSADSEAPLPGEKGDHNIPIGAVNPSHEDYISNGNGKAAEIKAMEKPDTAV